MAVCVAVLQLQTHESVALTVCIDRDAAGAGAAHLEMSSTWSSKSQSEKCSFAPRQACKRALKLLPA